MNNEIYELAFKAVALLKQSGLTVATAESCTGGLLAGYITAVPGSSTVIELGVTSYSNRIKSEVLGVKKETLGTYGAVSLFTAREMAEGIVYKSGADIGISVTGVAGPDRSEGHGAGLVYIALSFKGETAVKELNITPESRNYVREAAVAECLKLLINTIKEVN